MNTGTLIKVGAAITATAAMIAGGPALANTLGLADDSVAAMPASWETQRAVDAAERRGEPRGHARGRGRAQGCGAQGQEGGRAQGRGEEATRG